MMRNLQINVRTVVSRDDLLKQLRENRDEHRIIVTEARDGYKAAAKAALAKQLKAARAGQPFTLNFAHIVAPKDYTEAYETVIKMLEWSQDATMTLGADEFRSLVMNEWDWMASFLATTNGYSGSSRALATKLGL